MRAAQRGRRGLRMAGAEQAVREVFTTETERARHILESLEVVVPMGTRERAVERGVDMSAIAVAYGHVLARSIVALEMPLDPVAVSDGCRKGYGPSIYTPMAPAAFESWLMIAKGEAGTDADANGSRARPSRPLKGDELRDVSLMYGSMIGRTMYLAALELDVEIVADAVLRFLRDGERVFPMSEDSYNAMFENLQRCAATVLGNSNLELADTFFDSLRAQPGVIDLQGDGFVLAINGLTPAPSSQPAVDDTNTIHVALQCRLLDGRSILVPTYSDGDDAEPDYLETSLEHMPHALASGIRGLRPLESRTVFMHPYAAHEVIPVFGLRDEFPPQAGLVFDLFVRRIVS